MAEYTPEEAEAYGMGFGMPLGTHFIRNGDDAIRNNVVKMLKYARQAPITNAFPIDTTKSLDALTTPGDYQVTGNGQAQMIDLSSFPEIYRSGQLPVSAFDIEVRASSSGFVWQKLKMWHVSETHIFERQSKNYANASGGFSEWREYTLLPKESLKKTIGLQLTTQRNGMRWTANGRNYRLPFKFPYQVERFRVHIANYNDADDSVAPAPNLRISQPLYIGEHLIENGALTGKFVDTPVKATADWSVNLPDNSEWVSAWQNMPLKANTDYLFSYSLTNPGAAPVASGDCTSFFTLDYQDAGRAVPAGAMAKTTNAPLNIWLECEVSEVTQVVAYVGDSYVVGSQATNPLYDSPAWQKARREGFAPHLLAQVGNRLEWLAAAPDKPRWTRLSGCTRADYVVVEAGANDFFELEKTGISGAEIVAELKNRLEPVVSLARKNFSNTVYLVAPFTRHTKTFPEDILNALLDYRQWLFTLPFGAAGCFDWTAAVSNPDLKSIRAEFRDADKIHLNTAGYATLSAAPLSSRTPASDSRVDDLLRRVAELEAQL